MYMIVRARCLFPIAAAPVDNGAIAVAEGRVKWIGRWRDCQESHDSVVDLGEVALMPGLVNAHCHLDYTSMAGQIPTPRVFPDWVKNILSFKSHWSFSEFAESWLRGARMLLETGTTTVADTETVPELPPETWKSTPLRMISFFEMTGVKSRRSADELLREALGWIERWPRDERKEAALSPHALYSTEPELMRKSAAFAAERNFLLSVHLAESEAEHSMFADGKGPFFDWLKGQRKMDDCGTSSPIELAKSYGVLSPRTLIIHANYLTDADIATIASSGASVVHCPRSHDYFSHARFRYEDLVKASVNVCLATDSLASTRKVKGEAPVLNLWDEMQLFARVYPGVSPRTILGMVTENPAAALDKSSKIGTLSTGAFADFATLDYSGRIDEARLAEELLYNPRVREVFVGGELAQIPAPS
jgi:aminodeoxyfutalosine deaminase